MKKAIIFVLIAVIIGVIFLSVSQISQTQDSDVLLNEEEQEVEPKGRNLSVELDEKMGFSAP